MNRYDVMDALNHVEEAQLEDAGRFFEAEPERAPKRSTVRTARIVLIAAVITALLGVTAYAAGVFGLQGRTTAPEEKFPVRFESQDPENPPIAGNWTATYALSFDGPETCPPVRYRFGWLPEGVEVPEYWLTEDGWIVRRDWDGQVGFIPWAEHTELGNVDRGAYFISDVFYAPQFVNGGALILLSAVPEEITEETWGELSVLRFTSTAWWSTVTGETTPYDVPRNYVLLYSPEQGWIFTVRGTFPMEDLVKIAQNVTVEQTEGLVEQSQFENPFDFFDAATG